jgi:hypothetical protein
MPSSTDLGWDSGKLLFLSQRYECSCEGRVVRKAIVRWGSNVFMVEVTWPYTAATREGDDEDADSPSCDCYVFNHEHRDWDCIIRDVGLAHESSYCPSLGRDHEGEVIETMQRIAKEMIQLAVRILEGE